MTLRYINQLTEDELKELFTKFVESQSDLDVKNYFHSTNTARFIYLKGLCTPGTNTPLIYSVPIEMAFDDYDVYVYNEHSSNYEVAYAYEVEYRNHLRSKFGDQYSRDCFWYDLDED